MVSELLSASVERFDVSRMRDFVIIFFLLLILYYAIRFNWNLNTIFMCFIILNLICIVKGREIMCLVCLPLLHLNT